MRILLCNDDGVEAPGLMRLGEVLSARHEVWTVAPAREQSAQSHSLTMHKPLRALPVPGAERRWAVSGTPADCVYVALHHLMREAPPELVVSGINRGSNIGSDVHYSGTVAGAREACLHGYQAIAVSLHLSPTRVRPAPKHWDTAANVAARLAEGLAANPLPPKVFLNVNVPSVPEPELAGIRVCRLGDRVYAPEVVERIDPRGRPYLWIGGPHVHFGTDADSDGPWVERGFATVTPLSAAITNEPSLAALRGWVGG